MGVTVIRALGALDPSFILAPERYDPRRSESTGVPLGELVELVTDPVVAAGDPALAARVLVLDTSHAAEGLVRDGRACVAREHIGSSKRRVSPGDVVLSRLRPYLRQIGWIDPPLFARSAEGNGVLVSPEFFVFRAPPGESAAWLVPWLLRPDVQDMLRSGQEGGHHPRVNRSVVTRLRVPLDIADARVARAAEAAALLTTARTALDALHAMAGTAARSAG